MKVLLTGVTGNLGYEICSILLQKGHEPVLLVRSTSNQKTIENITTLHLKYNKTPRYLYCDLENEKPKVDIPIDSIIHSAGIVHFIEAGESNEKMAKNISLIAEEKNVPLYYISTAYLYKPDGEKFNNQYEIDKNNAKKVIQNITVPFAIISPSIIIGNSKSGEIMNFSGYYTVLASIIKAIRRSESVVHFPKFSGLVNVIPVDYVAEEVVSLVENKKYGEFFATNPSYTSFEEIIGWSLESLHLRDRFKFLDCSIEDYREIEKTAVEEKLFQLSLYFIPYWTIQYKFPETMIKTKFEVSEMENIVLKFKQLNEI